MLEGTHQITLSEFFDGFVTIVGQNLGAFLETHIKILLCLFGSFIRRINPDPGIITRIGLIRDGNEPCKGVAIKVSRNGFPIIRGAVVVPEPNGSSIGGIISRTHDKRNTVRTVLNFIPVGGPRGGLLYKGPVIITNGSCVNIPRTGRTNRDSCSLKIRTNACPAL